MKDTNEILRDYVGDMIATEKHLLESIERQTRDNRVRSYREAYELLMKVETVLSGHIISLEQYFSTIDGSGTGGTEAFLKKAATSAIGAMSGLYSKLRTEDPVMRDLRDDYTALSLAAISYTMLHTAATALNDDRLAEMSLRHLHDLTPFVVALSKAIPKVVAQELANEGKALDVTAGERAMSNTQEAWSHEVVGR